MTPDLSNPHEVEGVLNPGSVRDPDGQLYLLPRLVAAATCPGSDWPWSGPANRCCAPKGLGAHRHRAERRLPYGDRGDRRTALPFYGMADSRIGVAALDRIQVPS